MTESTILVVGAGGVVGTALVPALTARGVRVRAMTRDPQRRFGGAQTAVGDLRVPSSLGRALDGVDTVFLNTPSTEDAAELQIRFAEVAARSSVRRIVLLSQYGADVGSPVRFLRWHAEVEEHLRTLSPALTVLRPNLYLQSLLGFASTIAAGTLPAPAGDAAVSAIDTRDVAESAAVALTDRSFDGRILTLTGPRAVTHGEIAAALSAAVGAPIGYQDVPAEVFAGALTGLLPAWQVDGLVEDYAHYARGEAAEVTGAVAELTGHPARDVADFARDHAAAFIAR